MCSRFVLSLLTGLLVLIADAGIHVTDRFLGGNREMDGVDRCGNAISVYRLGSFDLGGRELPLYAYWTSADDSAKTLFGCGWHVPWMECRMLPVSETVFELQSMFGERLYFERDAKSPRQFRCHDVACATVGGNGEVKVYPGKNPGSTPDMTFAGGRLVGFRYRSKAYRLEYSDGRFGRMTCGGKTLLSVDRSGSDGCEVRIVFNGGKGGVVSARTGRVKTCVGDSGNGPKFEDRTTLVELNGKSSGKVVFAYGDRGGVGTMSDGGTRIEWDPATRRLLSRDGWSYDLSRHDPDHGMCSLRREKDGVVEASVYDARSGNRMRMGRGMRETSRLFTSGRFRGMLRWRERTRPDGGTVRTEYSYDRNRTLVYFKVIDKGRRTYTETWNDEKGRIVRFRENGDDATTCLYRYRPDGTRIVESAGRMRFTRATSK